MKIGLLLAAFGLAGAASPQAQNVPVGLWVRPGFKLTVAEATIKGPRFMEFGADGALFVSVPREGQIKICRDADNDGSYESVTPFVTGRDPKGIVQAMQWHDGWLWFAEVSTISKCRDKDGDGKADEIIKVIGEDQLPATGGGHRWRALMIHKGRIYTSVGDPGNATHDSAEKGERTKIWTFALDGSDKKLFATGLRNTEEFGIRPGTDEIWGVDHDIDNIGEFFEGKEKTFGQPITDHNPSAELNRYVEGGFYGHPYLVGKNMPNPMFFANTNLNLNFAEMASKAVVPEWTMAAHCAGNGMMFYKGDKIPNARGDVFVAMHGSWNATRKTGYSLSRILFENGHPYGEQKIVNFLAGGSVVLGRPVDCIETPDGSILVSDDTGNKIYRVSYAGN